MESNSYNASHLTEQSAVTEKVSILQKLKPRVSDIIDDEGHQYVDLVMEGGGTLGISILGYLYTLEQAGIRFLNIAGASAGSIIAMLLATGPLHRPRVKWILDSIMDKDFWDFVDGDQDSKNFIRTIIDANKNGHEDQGEGSFTDTLRKAWYFMCIIDNLSNTKKGLNPGNHFHEWMTGLLQQSGIKSLSDLARIRKEKKPRGLRNRITGKEVPDEEFQTPEFAELGIIAADVTTETKVVFPKMARLYWDDPDTVNPADFVRASMSIPIFFQPFEVHNIPYSEEAVKRWRELVNYQGRIPEKALFVDGGVISNFPIDLFHDYSKKPICPTLGVKIGFDRSRCNETKSFLDFLGAIFWSSAHCLDNDFILRNPDFKQLVSYIDYNSKRHGWLKFQLSDDDKEELFKNGVDAAYTFLTSFNWEQYKNSRVCLETNEPTLFMQDLPFNGVLPLKQAVQL